MRHRRRIAGVALLLAAAAWSAGCTWFGRAPGAARRPAPGATIDVTMTEFRFAPERIELPTGRPVRLTLRNRGGQAHELRLGRDAQPGAGYRDDVLAASRVRIVGGRGYRVERAGERGAAGGARILLEPGGEVTLELTVPPGKRGTAEMGCFLPGHYEAGMRGPVTLR